MTSLQKKQAVFCCNASAVLGYGHLRRCQALAESMRRAGWTCEFADCDQTPGMLRDAWPQGTEVLVVDGYNLGAKFESACRPWAERVIVLDDLANRRHDADILVDHNFGRKSDDYSDLVGTKCQVMTGSGFALLAEAFRHRRETCTPRKAPKRRDFHVVVSLGGGNSASAETALGAVLDAIDVVKGKLKTTFVVSAENQVATVKHRGHHSRLGLSRIEMAQLLASADIAIGAGGVSLLERCCLGIPGIVITIAENQRPGTAAAAATGACRDMGPVEKVSACEIAAEVEELVENTDEWQARSYAASQLTDGCGPDRIVAALSANSAPRADPWVSLRRPEREHAGLILDLQTNPGARQYSRNTNIPAPDEHTAWFNDRMALGGCILNLIYNGDAPVGILRLDHLTDGRSGYEVSILIAQRYRGQGIARSALSQAAHIASEKPLYAWVADDNVASHALFQSANYRPTGNGWYIACSARSTA